MDVVVDEELFAIETIISRTLFLVNKPSERRSPIMHPVMDKRNSEDIETKVLTPTSESEVTEEQNKSLFC